MKELYGKVVEIEATNGKTFKGKVEIYFRADDNEDGKESFAIEAENGDLVEFCEEDIKTLKVLDDGKG